MPEAEHPLREQIRTRVDELLGRRRALIAELEEVSTELGALQAAEREFIAGLARKVKLDRLRSDGELKPRGGSDSAPPTKSDPPPTPAPSRSGHGTPAEPQSRAAKTYLRRQAIVAFFEANAGYYSLDGVVELLPEATSRSTTRRDLDALVNEGKLDKKPRLGWKLAGGEERPEPLSIPLPPAPKPAKSRSNGIETPPRPAKRSAPFTFTDGDRKLLEILAERPLTLEGLAIKVRRPLLRILPRVQALTNAGYLSRGEQGPGNTVYGRTPRPLPR
jgi:hypothetical protein